MGDFTCDLFLQASELHCGTVEKFREVMYVMTGCVRDRDEDDEMKMPKVQKRPKNARLCVYICCMIHM